MKIRKGLTIFIYLLFLVAIDFKLEIFEKIKLLNTNSTELKVKNKIKDNKQEPLVMAKYRSDKN